MSRIRSSGTTPEKRLGELLQQMYPDMTLIHNPPELPGKPDWWLPELRAAIFADGCFFHRCPKHFIMPLNNQDYWSKKVARNRARDREINQALREMNIIPVRIWEHWLGNDVSSARRKIRRTLRAASIELSTVRTELNTIEK